MARFVFLLIILQLPTIQADDALNKLFCDTAVVQHAERSEATKRVLKSLVKQVEDISNPRNVRFGAEKTELLREHSSDTSTIWKLQTRDRKTQREEIDRLKAEYAERKKSLSKPWSAPLLEIREMRVGSIGFPVENGEPTSLPVSQVLSDQRVLIDWGERDFIFEGQDFSGVTDGQRALPTAICVVTSTETFTTVIGGTRTVFVMRAMSKEEVEEAMEYLVLNAPPVTPTFRKWTDATGAYAIEAEFVSSARGKVTLKKKDGSEVTLPLSKLSDANRDYAKENGDPW